MDDIEHLVAQMIRDGELVQTATGDWAVIEPVTEEEQ